MRENRITELEGVSIITKGFFNRLIRRIECTKPIKSKNIKVTPNDDGYLIELTAITYKLNVCSNGEPDKIIVFGTK
jgi:hypothetical protein